MSPIQISITTSTGTFVLDADTSNTIAELKQLLAQQQNSSIDTSTKLLFEDKPLDDSKTLADYDIAATAELRAEHSAEKDATVVKPKKRRNRCSFKSCISAPLRGVGDCRFCEGRFCSKHRLLEQHDCEYLQSCKQQMHERNAVRLQQQQTTAHKV